MGPVELVGVAERVARLLDPEARDLGVSVLVRSAEGKAHAHANATQVAQVLGNLIRNALEAILEAGGSGGEIDVSIAPGEPGFLLVSVHDTGKGISADRVEAIFAPFYSTKRAGTGLGLAVSRRIVESFGGRLWLESGEAGATFCLTLPRAEVAALVS
jgi:two-component system sensor kinase FixL